MFDEKYINGTEFVLIMIQMMVYLNCTKHSFVFEGVLFFVLKVGDELESMGFSNIYACCDIIELQGVQKPSTLRSEYVYEKQESVS